MEWLICDVVRLKLNFPLLLKNENDFPAANGLFLPKPRQ